MYDDAPAPLTRWLAWLATLHPNEIELGLERVRAVAKALGAHRPAHRVITVGGTNGKGSVVAHLERLLHAHGFRTGAYTSPHLHYFRERIRVDGAEVDDARIVAAFERVEHARAGIALTFFEFTTLAALEVFRDSGVDTAVLEVGMGGRLDATNVVDPDVAVVTSIGLDHSEWLGPDRDTIAREKAGIARPERPLIVGDRHPPVGLVAIAQSTGARIVRIGSAFDWCADEASWRFSAGDQMIDRLPLPDLCGGHALDNTAVALAAFGELELQPSSSRVRRGLADIGMPGRFEVRPGSPEIILDVAHNPEAATGLAEALSERASLGATHVILGMYADKNIAGVVEALAPVTDNFIPTQLALARAAAAEELLACCRGTGCRVDAWMRCPEDALTRTLGYAEPDDRIVIVGSFATVGAVRAALDTPERAAATGSAS